MSRDFDYGFLLTQLIAVNVQLKNQTRAFFVLVVLILHPNVRSAVMYAMLIGQVGIPTMLIIGKTKRAGLMLLRSPKTKGLASTKMNKNDEDNNLEQSD